jgi:hypothetical protein
MVEMPVKEQQNTQRPPDEVGQTVVIMVFMIIGLLVLVGLGADAGFVFARSSQFSAAVDSAALAGVVEMDPTVSNLDDADDRALEFLAANGWSNASLTTFVSTRTLTIQGIPQYTLTVTWPVETYFISLLGFGEVPVTRSSTAVYYSQAEIYTPTAFDRGHLRTGSQFILGPDACSQAGEPVSPNNSTPGVPNADASHLDGYHQYSIRVDRAYTETYPTHMVRVELFDPDSYNLNINDSATIDHTNSYNGGLPGSVSCSGGDGQHCGAQTGESHDAVNQNPYWFIRVDEMYNANCDAEPLNPNGNTITEYKLYYYDEDGQRVPWATYTAQNTSASDLKWVTPGVSGGVAVDSGSPEASFDVDIRNIPEVNGGRYIYLDVTATTGSSRNVWDLRAGPPSFADYTAVPTTLPSDVNTRNVLLANHPAHYHVEGISVYAIGRMPLQTWVNNRPVNLPLAPIDSTLGGGTIYSSIFDYDVGAGKALTFTIDSVSPTGSDGFRVPVQIVSSDPNPLNWQATCSDGTVCNNSWLHPQLRLGIPTGSFFGGNLYASYVPRKDAHTWSVRVTAGRPFLTR